MLERLTVQAYVEGQWHDAMTLSLPGDQQTFESHCSASYVQSYLLDFVDEMETRFEPAVSAGLPLGWAHFDSKGFPSFMYDIMPAGAARRSLVSQFGGEKPEGMSMDLFLLARFAPSPIGHLRIRESVECIGKSEAAIFTRRDLVERANRLVEDGDSSGSILRGATGAHGDSPKVLLVEDADGRLHPDALLPDKLARRHWLVKFARNQVTDLDKDILRSEYHYYRAAAQLGLNTISMDGLVLEEAERPSLWMPRFDRHIARGVVERVPVESIYSVCGNVAPGSGMGHEEVLRCLLRLWRANSQDAELEDLVLEYLQRDLLNRILGNSDNHGRNMAIFRRQGRFELSPIYDLAPMVLDPQGITRVTKWEGERLGAPDWRAVCGRFPDLIREDILFERLRGVAELFRALPDLLNKLPTVVKRSQSIPLNNLDEHLKKWGLR
ncbi:TPA: HipA domain-containing protein [Pseudomonas aeruginosa]|nr:HipA domain-containing protein [Pseudomonas aeruginosa]